MFFFLSCTTLKKGACDCDILIKTIHLMILKINLIIIFEMIKRQFLCTSDKVYIDR